MKLNILERITLIDLLPKEGNFQTLKSLRVLREELSFSEEENKDFEIKIEGDSVTWKDQGQVKEIEIGEILHAIIANQLKELDRTEKLIEQHMSLYIKFVK